MGQPPAPLFVADHVPPVLVRDFNIYDYPVADGDPQRALVAALHQPDVPPVFWSPHNGGHWVLTQAASIQAVIDDPDRFSNRYIGVPKALNPERILRPFQLDPPDHLPYRLLVSHAFSPRAVQMLRQEARRLAVALIEDLRPRGGCEFVGEFAQHMPIGIFMAIVGLPESDRKGLLAIAERIGRPKYDAERMEGYAALDDYIIELIAARRDAGADDFIGQLCGAQIDGRPLAHDELIGVIAMVLIAGLDTVAGILGFVALFLARHPERRRELRADPSLIPGAAEELLRRYGHVTLAREVRQDLEFAGVAMRKGDMVAAPLALHNLDPQVFARPLEVDFQRPRKPAHMSFGGSAHHCLGALLARAELQIFLEEWLARVPDFDVAADATLKVRTRVTAVLPALPLVWSA